MRKTFLEILEENNFSYQIEYERLRDIFYGTYRYDGFAKITLYSQINSNFLKIKFRKNALSLDDFDRANGYNFKRRERIINLDELISFCEYIINFITAISINYALSDVVKLIEKQVDTIMDTICYMPVEKKGITIFVPKEPAAIEVSQIVDEEISYKVLSYNHYSLKGNVEEKRKVLEKFALHLEPRQTELQELNPTLKKDIFYAFNNLNIRHNNLDETDAGNFNQKFSDFTDEEKEKLYDYVYNYCLEAFLELENKEGRRIIKDLKQV